MNWILRQAKYWVLGPLCLLLLWGCKETDQAAGETIVAVPLVQLPPSPSPKPSPFAEFEAAAENKPSLKMRGSKKATQNPTRYTKGPSAQQNGSTVKPRSQSVGRPPVNVAPGTNQRSTWNNAPNPPSIRNIPRASSSFSKSPVRKPATAQPRTGTSSQGGESVSPTGNDRDRGLNATAGDAFAPTPF